MTIFALLSQCRVVAKGIVVELEGYLVGLCAASVIIPWHLLLVGAAVCCLLSVGAYFSVVDPCSWTSNNQQHIKVSSS